MMDAVVALSAVAQGHLGQARPGLAFQVGQSSGNGDKIIN